MLPLSHFPGAWGVVTRDSLLDPRPWESGGSAGSATALQRLRGASSYQGEYSAVAKRWHRPMTSVS
jgi:hypothetical protein